MTATLADAYQLFHESSIALSEIEANGIRIDTSYLDEQIKLAGEKICSIEAKMRKDALYKTWQKEYGERTNIGSGDQIGHILFEVEGLPYNFNRTATGKYRTDRAVLESIDIPFVKDYLHVEDLKKDKATFLEGIKKECVDGFLHPFFHLASGDDDKGGARSFRSSSSAPNFHNFPNRDPERAAIIRRAFIPRGANYQLGEVDYKAAEVSVASYITRDKNLIAYVSDLTKDMHRDMARRIFFIETKDKVPKPVRNTIKAAFVFAQFYGDYYINCSKNIWGHILKEKLATSDGVPLRKHLKRHGITGLGECNPEVRPLPGTFEYHVKKEEQHFWYEMFPEYTEWKKAYYADYLEKGYFVYPTGFVVEGEYSKNQVLNLPIQGSSFHCLLWTICRLHKWLKKYKMKSKIVGQIHDSIVIDFHVKETQDILFKVKELVREKLPKVWDWVLVPLNVEMEVAPQGATWWDKKPWIENKGVWGLEED